MYHSFFIHLSIDGHLRKVLQGIVMRWELGHSGESERLLGSCQHHEPYNQKSGQGLSVNSFYPCLGICLKKKILIKKIHAPQYSQQHYLQLLTYGSISLQWDVQCSHLITMPCRTLLIWCWPGSLTFWPKASYVTSLNLNYLSQKAWEQKVIAWEKHLERKESSRL